MPLTFSQAVSVGDVMPNDRHTLYFPMLPHGVDGEVLTLRHGQVTLPVWEVPQIIVKQFGWSIAYAGRRNNPNTFTVSFVETTDAPALKNLVQWQAMANGLKSGTGKLKSQYAVKCKIVAADTTGKYGMVGYMYNVWPTSIQPGSFEEETGAWHHEVTFSVDAVDIEGITTYETALNTLPNMSYYPTPDETSYALTTLGYGSIAYPYPVAGVGFSASLAGSYSSVTASFFI